MTHLEKLELPATSDSDNGGGYLKIIPHDYHDHVLSMELRRRGELRGVLQAWFDGHVA